jgi:fatty-acyl-CoA synthase
LKEKHVAAWTYGNLWESVAGALKDEIAFKQGDRAVSYEEFDHNADALAAHFIEAGLTKQSKVGAYMYNSPEYMTAYFAAFKAGLAPFNTNYRYGPEELHYLFDNADAEAVVFHTEFNDRIDALRHRLPNVKTWVAVPEPGRPAPEWAADYEKLVAKGPPRRGVQGPWGRSEDDILMIYTGGTTGMPKGVMWRLGDLLNARGANPMAGLPAVESPEQHGPRLVDIQRTSLLPAAPIMHATGQTMAFGAISGGGTVVFLPNRKFDAAQLWDEVEAKGVSRVVIVGLAFCAPMLEALEANPGRWNLEHMRLIMSSGAMWSKENKAGLLKHMPNCSLFDSLGSSEAFGVAGSASRPGEESDTAKFTLSANSALFTEDGRRVEPGSGERGMLAITGNIPIGYYKDPAKTAATFREFEGKRWSVPGDWAELAADGTLVLLGRGSQCINTGGEKVFPEEVEESLKRHDAVRDAAVVGLPDPRFGERICALVELKAGAAAPSLQDLAAHVKAQLADYKAPRNLVIVESVNRAPNGKLDYKTLKALAQEKTAHAAVTG